MLTNIYNISCRWICLVGLVLIIIAAGISCKKLVRVDTPPTSLSETNIFTNDATAAAVLTGIYAKMSADNSNSTITGFTSISLYSSLSADELSLYDPNDQTYGGYYRNALTSSPNVSTIDYWSTIYPLIFITNAAIDGLNSSSTLTPAVKQQLLGEAKFMRAFCYFYLVNLFGDVPLVLSTDWKANTSLTRASKAQVYQQIIDDLKDAQNLLHTDYLMSDALTPYPANSMERTRPTKWAAAALLARVYLYTGDYPNAETQATMVIDSSALYVLSGLDSVFLKNSTEAIWQLQPVGTGTNSNTGEGRIFILPPSGPAFDFPVYLSTDILNSFESGDQRRVHWVDSVATAGTIYYFPFKYKIGAVTTTTQEYCMVLRLAEQYLIRAEARIQQNDIGGARNDLNIIRARAGLGNTSANDKPSLLAAMLQERRVELFTEWGHRWLDLKRTNTVDAVMSLVTPTKGGTWATTAQLYPIPLTELKTAPQLAQNPGY